MMEIAKSAIPKCVEDLEDFRDIDGVRVQPLFALFMIQHGYSSVAETQARLPHTGLEFMLWNSDQWQDYDKQFNVKPNDRGYHLERYRRWLFDRVAANKADKIRRAA